MINVAVNLGRCVIAAAFMFVLLLLCDRATAEQAGGEGGQIWVEAVGEAAGSDYDPPKEVMERARADAKRRALEEAVGTFVRSHTLVSNAQLAEEFTFARVRGRIERVSTISEERDRNDPNLYRVRLKALVRPLYPEEDKSLHIRVDLGKNTFRSGEEIRIHYQVDSDCYIYIFSIAADNSVTLLFPNSLLPDNFVRANIGQVFPPKGAAIKLQAISLPRFADRPSQERIKVIATRVPEIILHGFQEGIFRVYDAASTGLVGDLARKLSQIDPADWGEAVRLYTIAPAESK